MSKSNAPIYIIEGIAGNDNMEPTELCNSFIFYLQILLININ